MKEFTKIERTDADVDNSVYEIKSSYEVTDDYGKTETFYNKEERLVTEYDTQLDEQITSLEERLLELKANKATLNKL
jgi:prefoldin subunit 5